MLPILMVIPVNMKQRNVISDLGNSVLRNLVYKLDAPEKINCALA